MDCPNCLTPWKCNGPHLEPLTKSVYSSIDGYYIKSELEEDFKFHPKDNYFSAQQLLDVINTLNILNNYENTK